MDLPISATFYWISAIFHPTAHPKDRNDIFAKAYYRPSLIRALQGLKGIANVIDRSTFPLGHLIVRSAHPNPLVGTLANMGVAVCSFPVLKSQSKMADISGFENQLRNAFL